MWFVGVILVDNVPVFEWVVFVNGFAIVPNHTALASDYRTPPSFEIVIDVPSSMGTDQAVRHRAMAEYALRLFLSP